jgi:hypothetical protein
VISVPSDEGEVAESVLEREVGGEYTTFKVYLYVIRTGDVSPREVYHKLGMSSPSLALHHLEKLEKLGLVSRDEHGKYRGVRRKFGVLRFFIVTGRWLFPRTFFYMMFYVLVAFVSVFLLPSGAKEAALFLSLVGFVTNFAETLEFYRILP